MAEPDALVLMLLVDDRRMRVIRQTMNELPLSRLTLNLDAPLAPQMRAGSSDLTPLLERLDHYLKVCRYVLFVVGNAAPPPRWSESRDVLARLMAGVEARVRGGGAVGRMKLGESSAPMQMRMRTVGIDLSGYVRIDDGDERALVRFIRQAVLNLPAAASLPEPSPQEEAARRRQEEERRRCEESWLSQSRLDYLNELRRLEMSYDPKQRFEEVRRGVPAAREAEGSSVDDAPAPDEVFCTVYAPRLAAPGDEILVQAFAHLRRQEQELADLAAAADPEAAKVAGRRLDGQVAEGERLGFHLTVRGAEIDAPDQEYVWRREVLAAQFGVYFPETSRPRDVVGTVIITRRGVPIGHVKFTLRVVTREQKDSAGSVAAERSGQYAPYRTAFVSYASKDREEVVPRVQALAAARIDVFQDFIELEPGERWEQGLYKHIDRCDVFFLFWSQAAKDSEWVREEAKYAHARQEGKDDRPPEIIPIIIEGPPPVEPPPELNFLHFNDKYIYLLKGVEAEAEARRKGGA